MHLSIPMALLRTKLNCMTPEHISVTELSILCRGLAAICNNQCWLRFSIWYTIYQWLTPITSMLIFLLFGMWWDLKKLTRVKLSIIPGHIEGLSRSWSYGCWIYNYLCNQCISPLTLWVRISFRRDVLDDILCDNVC